MPVIYSSSDQEVKPVSLSVEPEKKEAPEKKQMPQATESRTQHSYLHSLCIYPQNIKFQSQQKDEQIILFVRAHPITQLPWVITAIAGLILPVFVNLFIGDYLTFKQIIFVNLAWHSILLTYIFMCLLNWQFNIGLITNRRILDIDYHGILYKEINATTISNIEDVTGKTAGLFSSIFGYGNVSVQTAGMSVNIEFFNVPKPMKIVKTINSMVGSKS